MICRIKIGNKVASFHTVERTLYRVREGAEALRDPYGFWTGDIAEGDRRFVSGLPMLDFLHEEGWALVVGEGDCGKSVFMQDLSRKREKGAIVKC